MGHCTKNDGKPYPLFGRQWLAVPCQGLDAVDALRAAEDVGPLAHQFLNDDPEGERHHRQVGALDAEGRQGDQHAANA
jgi:hypothetical protein